jgi:hypothetical protein
MCLEKTGTRNFVTSMSTQSSSEMSLSRLWLIVRTTNHCSWRLRKRESDHQDYLFKPSQGKAYCGPFSNHHIPHHFEQLFLLRFPFERRPRRKPLWACSQEHQRLNCRDSGQEFGGPLSGFCEHWDWNESYQLVHVWVNHDRKHTWRANY